MVWCMVSLYCICLSISIQCHWLVYGLYLSGRHFPNGGKYVIGRPFNNCMLSWSSARVCILAPGVYNPLVFIFALHCIAYHVTHMHVARYRACAASDTLPLCVSLCQVYTLHITYKYWIIILIKYIHIYLQRPSCLRLLEPTGDSPYSRGWIPSQVKCPTHTCRVRGEVGPWQ